MKTKTIRSLRKAQSGFAHPELILVALVVLAVVGVGFYVFKGKSGGILSSLADVTKVGKKSTTASSSGEAQAVPEARDYTFELRKDGKAVANNGTVSGPVEVGINMNVDRNLSNIKFFVDGVEKGSKQGIGLTGYRDLYTWHTKFDANGQHTLSVKATGTSGKEFEVRSVATDTKSMSVTVDNGTATRVTGSGSSGTSGGGSTTNTNQNTTISQTPQLSVIPGPLDGVAGSQSGTVSGENVSGGIVFQVTFKRPKSEVYDTKTMNVVVKRDGVPRLTISKDSNSLEVKEDGDFKVYTFKRYYATSNKPNGKSTWQAVFTPSVNAQLSETTSNSVVINVENPNSLADKTCREAKNKVNEVFGDIEKKLEANQASINEVASNTDKRYVALGLSVSNPIPNYAAKKAQLVELNNAIDARQNELKALEIKCADGPSPEDIGATVSAYQLKLEETKGALSSLRQATLNLLGDLRSRLPQDSGDDVAIPAGFKKHSTPCYSFAARDGFTTSDLPSGPKGPCNKVVNYSMTLSGSTFDFSITPAPWKLPTGSLDENVAAAKAADLAAGSSATEIVGEERFQLDGQEAVKYTVVNPTPLRMQRVIVAYPYEIDGQRIGGFDISMLTGNGSSVSDSDVTGFATRSANKALSTWRWKDTGSSDDTGTLPDGFKKGGTFCFATVIPDGAKFNKQFSSLPDGSCRSQAQFEGSPAVFAYGIAKGDDLDALVREAKKERRNYNPGVQFEDPEDTTLGGQPAKRIVFSDTSVQNGSTSVKGIMYVSKIPQDYAYSDKSRIADKFVRGSHIDFIGHSGDFGYIKRTADTVTAGWRWKDVPVPSEKFSRQDTACYSVELPKRQRQQIVLDPPILKDSCFNAYTFRSAVPLFFGRFYAVPAPDQTPAATLESNVATRKAELATQRVVVGPDESITLGGQPGVRYMVSYPTDDGRPDIDYEYIVSAPKRYAFEDTAGVNTGFKTLRVVVNTTSPYGSSTGFSQQINAKIIDTWEWK